MAKFTDKICLLIKGIKGKCNELSLLQTNKNIITSLIFTNGGVKEIILKDKKGKIKNR